MDDAIMSPEDKEFILGKPKYLQYADPYKEESYNDIMKFLNENDPDALMGRELSKMYQNF